LKSGHDTLPLYDNDVRDTLYDLIGDVQKQGTVKGSPKIRSIDESDFAEGLDSDDGSYTPSTPTLTIKNCEWRTDEHLHLLVAIGEAGLHEDLVDPDSQLRQSILNQSAEVTLRVDIYLPIAGTKAILVTETQGMHDPVGRLFSWIQYQWILRKDQLEKSNKEQIAEWKEARSRGESVGDRPKTLSYKRYYLRRARLGDAALLKKIIDTAESGSAEFYELGTDGKKKHSLTRHVNTKMEIGTLGKALQKFGAGNDNLQKTREETVLELVEDLDYDATSLQAAGVNLEGATLKLSSDAGNVTFKAGHASDVFTYPFKSGRPKDKGYYEATVTKAQALAPAASIELDDLEDWEVCEWLAKDPARSPLDQPSTQS
jgi:hypothetical protein